MSATQARSIDRVRHHAPTLQELSSVWAHAEPGPLWWDNYNLLFVRECSRRSTDKLFGHHQLKNVASAFKSVANPSRRRWEGPFDLGLDLPPDAVIIKSFCKRGPVVASQGEGTVLKLVATDDEDIENEVDALLLARDSRLDHHTQEILDHGTASNGTRWMTSRLAYNDRLKMASHLPLLAALWHRWLQQEGLPFLHTYYRTSGIEVSDYERTREHALAGLAEVEGLDPLTRRLAGFTTAVTRGSIVTARIHGDLSSSHVHRSKHGWKLIDWGASRRRAVFYELFRPYWGNIKHDSPQHIAFWTWILCDLAPARIPARLRRDIDLFTDFYRRSFNIALSNADLRAHLLCVIVSEAVAGGRHKKLQYLAGLSR